MQTIMVTMIKLELMSEQEITMFSGVDTCGSNIVCFI